MSNEYLQVNDLSFGYDGTSVVEFDNLRAAEGEIVAILGPSGSGKTTLFKIIAGLIKGYRGMVTVGGAPPDVRKNKSSMVFQEVDAYPWMTAERNLRGLQHDSSRDRKFVDNTLRELGLWEARKKYPQQLSGGMRKRVALGRALIRQAKLLLLDEAFSSLDIRTKMQMWDLVKAKVRTEKMACLTISHDIEEACMLADKVIITDGPPLSLRRVIVGNDISPERIRDEVV